MLSIPHTESLKARGKIIADGPAPERDDGAGPERDHVGIGHLTTERRKPKYVLEIQEFCKEYAPFLKGRCILTSAIIGFLQCLFSGPVPMKFFHDLDLTLLFSNVRNNKKLHNRQVQKVIADLVEEVLNECPSFDEKSLVQQLTFLAEKWDINFTVFNKKFPDEIIYVPDCTDITSRKVFLLINKNEKHIQFIDNVESYFNQGYYCLYCQVSVKSYRQLKHDCKVRKTCQFCHRYTLEPGEFSNHNFDKIYCKSHVDTNSLKHRCNNCDLQLSDTACFTSHGKLCKYRFKCKTCNAYLHINNRMKSRVEMEKNISVKKNTFAGIAVYAAQADVTTNVK